MSYWGTEWGTGFFWGSVPLPGPDDLCDLSDDRVLVQMDDSPGNRKFRDLLCDFLYDAGVFNDVAEDVRSAFDVNVAQGEQLDFIGALVGLARQGFDDNDYRRFLTIQIQLLLSGLREDAEWTGTHQNIVNICRTFIGDGVADPVVLDELAPSTPYSFLLTVPGLTIETAKILASFVRVAIYAAVLGQMIIILADDSLWNSASVAVPGGGTWGSASVVVPGAAFWNTAVVI